MIVSVNINESASVVLDFVTRNGLTFRNLLDLTADTARAYRVSGIPASFFIDGEGVIGATHIGPLKEELIARYLERLQ